MATMMKRFEKRMKNIRVHNLMPKQLPSYLSLSIFCALFLFTSAVRAAEVNQQFQPGIYDFLMLAVTPEEEILGSYRETQGYDVVKTCAFLLRGKGKNGQVDVITWSDQFFQGELNEGETYLFPGLLKYKSHGRVILKIKLGREHPGCGLVLSTEISEGIELTRTTPTQWISLKLVKNARAPLFSGPSIEKKTKAYFIRNDVLGVLSVNGEWIKVEFPREGKKMIKGWVRSSDVEDLQPPPKK